MLNFFFFFETVAVVELLEEAGVGCAWANGCYFNAGEVATSGNQAGPWCWAEDPPGPWALLGAFMPGSPFQTPPLVTFLCRKMLYFNFLIPL